MTPDLAGLPKGYPFKTEYEFSPREFEALMKRGRVIDGDGKTSGTAGPKVMLVDVRTQPEWETARVAGSVFAPLDQLEQLASNLALEEADEIGVICHHGVRSMKAAMMLRELGFAQAKSVAGGIEAWSLGVDQSVPRYERQGLKVWRV